MFRSKDKNKKSKDVAGLPFNLLEPLDVSEGSDLEAELDELLKDEDVEDSKPSDNKKSSRVGSPALSEDLEISDSGFLPELSQYLQPDISLHGRGEILPNLDTRNTKSNEVFDIHESHSLQNVIEESTLVSTESKKKHRSGEDIVLDYITQDDVVPSSKQRLSSETVRLLKRRLIEYRNAAVNARSSGDLERAKQLLLAANCLDEAIPRIESGEEPFDPNEDMPPPPDIFYPPSPPTTSTRPQPAPTSSSSPTQDNSTVVTADSLTTRISILQALVKNAQISNDPKVNMFKRALDSHAQALKAFRSNAFFDYKDLIPPPGCPPYTTLPSAGRTQNASASDSSSVPQTSNQRIVELLQKRQLELRTAAAKAKSSGDMVTAKEHLRASMSMNNMIRAAASGLPVDLKQLPPPPGMKKSSEGSELPVLSGQACDPPLSFQARLLATKSLQDRCQLIASVLEEQAVEAEQLSQDHRASGLALSADKLASLANISRQSISFVQVCQKREKEPKYAFEAANLSQLNLNPDLGENVLEVTAVRGISLPIPPGVVGPDTLDTYVTFELPFPSSDAPQKHSTAWAKHTNEPTDYGGFQASARFEVTRKARSYERLLQGVKSLKATVYYNRGLLKKAGVLGTVSCKLSELLTSATTTVCLDLMDGRRAVGGRLELRLRHRAPLSGSKFSTVQKPWLVIQSSTKSKK